MATSDYTYTVYVSWVKDGQTFVEEISANGGVSSDEDSEPADLFSEDVSSTPGYLIISGDLFQTAFGRLPALAVSATGETDDVDQPDEDIFFIYLNNIEHLQGVTLDLSLLLAILE